jgi:hypothetical protein
MPNVADDANDLDRIVRPPDPAQADADDVAIRAQASRKGPIDDRHGPAIGGIRQREGTATEQRHAHHGKVIGRHAAEIRIEATSRVAVRQVEGASQRRSAHRQLRNRADTLDGRHVPQTLGRLLEETRDVAAGPI